jgi:hypothetical protein
MKVEIVDIRTGESRSSIRDMDLDYWINKDRPGSCDCVRGYEFIHAGDGKYPDGYPKYPCGHSRYVVTGFHGNGTTQSWDEIGDFMQRVEPGINVCRAMNPGHSDEDLAIAGLEMDEPEDAPEISPEDTISTKSLFMAFETISDAVQGDETFRKGLEDIIAADLRYAGSPVNSDGGPRVHCILTQNDCALLAHVAANAIFGSGDDRS